MLGRQLNELREELAEAAQKVVDAWEQDNEGFDEVYGCGGPCDDVANAMADVVAERLDDVKIDDGGQEGSDHAFLVVSRADEMYIVDIPPGVYETGGGYKWRKIEGAIIDADDVMVYHVE